jgi:cell wall-associated NlpC family hydrolase
MSEARIRQIKARVARLAREQRGAHYVWGGYGNYPDRPDSNPFPGSYGRRVSMYPDDPSPNPRDHGRRHPVLNTAFTNINNRIYVCGGRCSRVAGTPRADVSSEDVQHAHEVYTWPRPDDAINSPRVVWGESCQGIRHFDCIGFVNWCYFQILRRHIQYSIAQWRTIGSRRISRAQLEPGDILSAENAGGEGNTSRHIGLYIGNGRAVHARSYRIGVEETALLGGGTNWDYFGSPSPALF